LLRSSEAGLRVFSRLKYNSISKERERTRVEERDFECRVSSVSFIYREAGLETHIDGKRERERDAKRNDIRQSKVVFLRITTNRGYFWGVREETSTHD